MNKKSRREAYHIQRQKGDGEWETLYIGRHLYVLKEALYSRRTYPVTEILRIIDKDGNEVCLKRYI